jgi:hypothetical protein
MRQRVRGWLAASAALALAGGLTTGLAGVAGAVEADDETQDLVLLLDGSGSIDPRDWTLQLDGYAAALQDRVNFPLDGSMAVSVIQWSHQGGSSGNTRVEVPLTVLDSADAVKNVVQRIRGIAQIAWNTNPGDAVRAGTNQLLSSGREDAAWTLCMSTDGSWNSGESLPGAVAFAQSSGVDRYGVVAIEDGGFNAASAMAAYGPHVFGGGTVTVARTTGEFTSMISGCVADPLRLESLQVTQVVQDWDNSVPLVDAKPTVVRAFLETIEGDPVRTSGRLRGTRGGSELPGSPLTALNGGSGVLVDDDAAPDRDDLEATLNFALPAAWTTGDVELSLELPGGVVCEGAGSCTESVSFEDGFAMDVEYRGLSWEEGGTTREPTFAGLFEQHERSVSQFPTSGWRAGFSTIAVDERPDELEDVNEALHTARRVAKAPAEQRWYGVMHDESDGGGLASGRVASGWDGGVDGVTETGHARNRAPHELGHTYGLHHSVNAAENGWTKILWIFNDLKKGWCGEVADGSAPDYPHWDATSSGTVATLGPMGDERTEIWGTDVRFVGSDEDLALSSPDTNTSLMSYCRASDRSGQQRWIGKRDYEQLLTSDRGPISGDDQQDLPATDGTGLSAPDGATAELKPALAVALAPTPDDAEGTHAVVLRDAEGAALHTTRFTPVESHGEPPVGGDLAARGAMFNVVVPVLPTVASIEVRSTSGALATAAASPNAPQVSVDVPEDGSSERLTVDWESSDVDAGTALAHTVLYSSDDGATWDVVALDITGTSVSLPRWALAGTPTARLQVIASDGVRSTAAISPSFSLPNLAPRVSIASPADGEVFSAAQTISLVAEASDVEDGVLDDTSVQWTSDRDGSLGDGARLLVRADQLSEGPHVVTVTARDSGGLTTSATVRITVQRVAEVPNEGPLVTVDGLTDGAAYGDSQRAVVTWEVTDTGSGVASVVATLDGAPLESGTELVFSELAYGEHVLVVTATDDAGVATTVTVTFTVETSFDDLAALLTQFNENGTISDVTTANVRDRLDKAWLWTQRGSEERGMLYLGHFVDRVNHQVRGDADDLHARAVLVRSAQALIAQLQAAEDEENAGDA